MQYSSKEKMDQQPHILMLPYPILGHIKPMLSIAELLCHNGLHVTFLNTNHNHHRLTNQQVLSTHFPTLHFESISDGLPVDDPHDNVYKFVSSIKSVMKPLFRELLADSTGRSKRPITCIIVDSIMSFAIDFAKELGIPVITFRCLPASCLWSFFCLPKLIEDGQIPVVDDNMNHIVIGIPGMEGLLRHRDLPSLCRQPLDDPMFQLFLNETQAMTTTSGLILNTFDELEAPIFTHMTPIFPKIYTIGPLSTLLISHIGYEVSRSSLSSSDSLWEADGGYMTWLDSQPLRSVVYVSFGSLVMTTRVQILEIWHGLVNSGKPFLWVIRRDSIVGENGEQEIPEEIQARTKEKGFLVDWAPQEDVLAHPAVGGFFTHSGWNSTMECIAIGVPMICWPQFGHQQINSRCVSEVWRIGLEMKDECDRLTVEKMIRTVMEDKKEEFIKSIDRIAQLAHDSVSLGGSSYNNLNKLIEDLRNQVRS